MKGKRNKSRVKTRKRKSQRYKIIFKERAGNSQKRTGRKAKNIFTRTQARKTN